MCGFICVVNRRKYFEKKVQIIPPDVLDHRGPDYSEELVYKNVSYRHWRLSIVDLSTNSNQPIFKNNKIFVYNGEIYDYSRIAKSYNIHEEGDTKLVFQMLNKKNGFEKIRSSAGFYSFLLHDLNANNIFGSRDKFGKKPLFYYLDSEKAIFSSEEIGILNLLNEYSVNMDAIGEYLLYKNRFFGKACFNKINEIAPGAFFNFNIADWEINHSYGWHSYYDNDIGNYYNNGMSKKIKFDEELFSQYLSDAVLKRINCDVPVQIALSGGIDSSTITSLALQSKASGNVLRTLTVGFTKGIDESNEAKYISDYFKIDNKKILFDNENIFEYLLKSIAAMNAPLDHPHALAYFILCKEAQKRGKVLITGEGADEIFFGYDHYKNFKGQSFAFREFLNYYDNLFFCNNIKEENLLFSIIRKNANIMEYRSKAKSSPYSSRDMEMKTHLLSLLQRNDKMSMANSVEIRSPFLEPKIIEMALNAKNQNFVKNKKDFIRKIFTSHESININSPKNGFRVPIDDNIKYIKNHKLAKDYIDIASDKIKSYYGYDLINRKNLSPRLIWSLINIGCFLEIYDN